MPGLPDAITREAYSHEVSSAGFWPGNDAFPSAVFYSYAYPEPPGFRDRAVAAGGYFDAKLGEFILPYETVRLAAAPDAVLLDFLWSTYPLRRRPAVGIARTWNALSAFRASASALS